MSYARKMDRVHLLPMELPSASSINASGNKGKCSFLRRLAFGFIILAALGLLYVPAYHSVQSPLLAQLHGWGYNTSRDVCTYIHPENKTTILSPSDLCTPPPFLLVVVCSAVANQKARSAVRNTWANKYNLDNSYNFTVRVAFLLGQSDNETLNNSVAEESEKFNDIIQERFLDTYNNLTLKSVMLLKWVSTNCEPTKYLMKTDDDMFINIPKLLEFLNARPQSNGTLIGCLICNAKPILDPRNKWYTPKYMYAEKAYPNYLSGTAYVMSLDVASKLYQEALKTPILHLEDVYITGVCAKRAKLRPVNHPGFSYVPRKADPCLLKSVITAHKVSPTNMYTTWSKVTDSNITCSMSNHSSEEKRVTLVRGRGNIGYYIVKKKPGSMCA
ncbi:beta-1,3-galactosyltransferase 1-like isoform X2 [Belonocnema kinseyi]|uniref:beta-1,3-galactosyltransferase 1-like isoform X2 n=1 Tax=Belonocnema kinseyi TaxID=2817044 RepID=UPI00143D27BA|nr:beta-1,3-galactosyltransferase 1-like isoform X2 [Belonocnema kinseyi]